MDETFLISLKRFLSTTFPRRFLLKFPCKKIFILDLVLGDGDGLDCLQKMVVLRRDLKVIISRNQTNPAACPSVCPVEPFS
jgi:hypothetical protein